MILRLFFCLSTLSHHWRLGLLGDCDAWCVQTASGACVAGGRPAVGQPDPGSDHAGAGRRGTGQEGQGRRRAARRQGQTRRAQQVHGRQARQQTGCRQGDQRQGGEDRAPSGGQFVQHPPARIVAGLCVFLAYVTEANDQLYAHASFSLFFAARRRRFSLGSISKGRYNSTRSWSSNTVSAGTALPNMPIG